MDIKENYNKLMKRISYYEKQETIRLYKDLYNSEIQKLKNKNLPSKEYNNELNKIKKDIYEEGMMSNDNVKSSLFSAEKKLIKGYYNEYKRTLTEYEYGNIPKKQYDLVTKKLEKEINKYSSFFSKQNTNNIKQLSEDKYMIMNARIEGEEGIKSKDNVVNRYERLANFINKKLNEYDSNITINKRNVNSVTADDLYNKIYSGANETPYYEEKLEYIATSKNELKEDLKSAGFTDDDIETVLSLLRTGRVK